jgi:hypothetical protein
MKQSLCLIATDLLFCVFGLSARDYQIVHEFFVDNNITLCLFA